MHLADIVWNSSDIVELSPSCRLSVGVVLVPDFTMLAFAAFVDTLRLAADEGDGSRQLRCRWAVMSDGGHPVRASNGVLVTPTSDLIDPAGFDYVVVVGGTLHRGPEISDTLDGYLATAARLRVPLVGLCTGAFILARAGLMENRRACVSWFHKAELEAEFPALHVVADQLFVIDRDRITCAGGTSVIHVASHLIEKHCGSGRAAKGLRVMLEDRARGPKSPQPAPHVPGFSQIADPRVRRAILFMERHIADAIAMSTVAAQIGTTPRQLNRLFASAVGLSPAKFLQRFRLHQARGLLGGVETSITQIAIDCGFSDASHFSRCFRRAYNLTPSQARTKLSGSPQNPFPPAKRGEAC